MYIERKTFWRNRYADAYLVRSHRESYPDYSNKFSLNWRYFFMPIRFFNTSHGFSDLILGFLGEMSGGTFIIFLNHFVFFVF